MIIIHFGHRAIIYTAPILQKLWACILGWKMNINYNRNQRKGFVLLPVLDPPPLPTDHDKTY